MQFFFYFFNIYRHPKRYIGFEAKLTELTKYNNLLSIYEALFCCNYTSKFVFTSIRKILSNYHF